MGFESIAEVRVDPGSAYVYEEGWQSWSPAGVYRASATSPSREIRSGLNLLTVPGRGRGLFEEK